ncbi:MAG: ATP-binding protein, partial [Spirochaetales bacterium]|nr:ATP-binding protein [Spirochaetales bacterium]
MEAGQGAIPEGRGSKSMTKYPFSAIVGQEAMKTALILHAVDPSIGGVLIRGHKGTAKSTAVRALQDLLPPLKAVEGCPYHCDPEAGNFIHKECRLKAEAGIPESFEMPVPLVELPLGATEDRLVGALQLEKAIHSGERVFEPGLLAAANRGILYVDEVNLLDDQLVDLLLDTAASGVNRVEREGLSEIHPSKFILIGTMNPEEGELRPQFLDRFGLCISVTGEDDVKKRSELIRRRLDFERDPDSFSGRWEELQQALREQIAKAKENLKKVSVPDDILDDASTLAVKVGAQGHRAEITIIKVAVALAAFQERDSINHADVVQAATMALPHRLDRYI